MATVAVQETLSGSIIGPKDSSSMQPRKEVIWLDASVRSPVNYCLERDAYFQARDVHLLTTTDEKQALEMLANRERAVIRRVVTAGRGGENLVVKLRSAGVMCDVLVFCANVNYHRAWAVRYPLVSVTCEEAVFKRFVYWKENWQPNVRAM